MTSILPHRVKTISEFHKLRGLPKPVHTLISVIDLEKIEYLPDMVKKSIFLDFYFIFIKRCSGSKFKYGQQEYDFNEGIMGFIAPGQVFGINAESYLENKISGWILFVHPDFLWNTSLAKTIRKYKYFGYSANEALFLSEKEEGFMIEILSNIEKEYHSNIDQFSQNVIIAQLELLFTYAERFYHRQFLTRKITNHQLLNRLEEFLDKYFNSRELQEKGLPTVQYIAEQLFVSPNYLSEMLKVLTGLNTQQHIHEKLIEKAKEMLSTTDLSVKEIAYTLGFEHPQSFNKFFKKKMNLSPLKFKQSFY